MQDGRCAAAGLCAEVHKIFCNIASICLSGALSLIGNIWWSVCTAVWANPSLPTSNPLTLRAWQRAYNKICTLSCAFHSWCWADKGGGQRGGIKCHNESKRHNSFGSNALQGWVMLRWTLLTTDGPAAEKTMRRDWRAHINSNYSQCMRSCKWPSSQWWPVFFNKTTPFPPSESVPSEFLVLWKCCGCKPGTGAIEQEEWKQRVM